MLFKAVISASGILVASWSICDLIEFKSFVSEKFIVVFSSTFTSITFTIEFKAILNESA